MACHVAGRAAGRVADRETDSAARDVAYARLGLLPDADDRAIKTAFRRQAVASHPDRHPHDPDAPSRFVEVRQAYECLRHGDGSRPADPRSMGKHQCETPARVCGIIVTWVVETFAGARTVGAGERARNHGSDSASL